jgi:hypothetical protein
MDDRNGDRGNMPEPGRVSAAYLGAAQPVATATGPAATTESFTAEPYDKESDLNRQSQPQKKSS